MRYWLEFSKRLREGGNDPHRSGFFTALISVMIAILLLGVLVALFCTAGVFIVSVTMDILLPLASKGVGILKNFIF